MSFKQLRKGNWQKYTSYAGTPDYPIPGYSITQFPSAYSQFSIHSNRASGFSYGV